MAVPPVLYQRSYARSPADLILVVGEDKTEIPVHRIILFCATPFFERLVHYRMSAEAGRSGERQEQGVMRIEFADVSYRVMSEIVKYCYSGTVDVTSRNVEELLRVADMFVIDHIVHACQSFQESANRSTSSQASKRRWNPRTG